jgi:hypothetical protein
MGLQALNLHEARDKPADRPVDFELSGHQPPLSSSRPHKPAVRQKFGVGDG